MNEETNEAHSNKAHSEYTQDNIMKRYSIKGLY